jgi:hypothetical protein
VPIRHGDPESVAIAVDQGRVNARKKLIGDLHLIRKPIGDNASIVVPGKDHRARLAKRRHHAYAPTSAAARRSSAGAAGALPMSRGIGGVYRAIVRRPPRKIV